MKTLLQFWLSHPALLYGISFLLGLYCALETSYWLIVPIFSLWLPFFVFALSRSQINSLNHLLLSILIFFTGWISTSVHYHLPLLPEEGIQGQALVHIQSIALQQSSFGERWVYRCRLKEFIPFDSLQQKGTLIPCTVSFPAGEKEIHPRPKADRDYSVEGKLIQNSQGAYVLKVSSKNTWHRIEESWSWAEQRYAWKQITRSWIESRYSHPLSGSFLAGLATGEFDDSWMKLQFARFGLQHLLAISGLDFAILAGVISLILRLIPMQKINMGLLLLCLASYCFFLGSQASIMRAWIMCSLAIAGLLLEKQPTALNSLGFSLIALLGWDPLISRGLEFQLSYSTTAAILLFYQPAQRCLSTLFPKRKLGEVIEMNGLNQHGYFIIAFMRESLALALAVNIFAVPLTLFYFHQFPWMSLLYNLFFPLLTSVSLCLLMFGSILTFLPPVAFLIHGINDYYTYFVLQLTYQIPSKMDAYLITDPLPAGWMILYLTLAVLCGILWKAKADPRKQEIFPFI